LVGPKGIRESPHTNGPINDFTFAPDTMAAVRSPSDRHDAEVDVGRQTDVEPHFRLASVFARGEGPKIQEAEVDGLLHFPYFGGAQEHPGDVRLDADDGLSPRGEDARAEEVLAKATHADPTFDRMAAHSSGSIHSHRL
jgi:hypothetical protein